MRTQRSIAQPGRALRSGRRGRGFEPRYSDHTLLKLRVAGHKIKPAFADFFMCFFIYA